MDKIFTGMENGPDTIQKNFDSQTQAIDTYGYDSGWVSLTLLTGASGTITVRRQGQMCVVYGRVKTTESGSITKPVTLANLPAQFKPDIQIIVPGATTFTTTDICKAKVQLDPSSCDVAALLSPVNDEFFFESIYFTSADAQ